MIDEILPRDTAAVAVRRDFDASLYPEEEVLIRDAVEVRRREFVTARACARAALSRLGFPPRAIGAGPHGDPHWPAGAVGSITHCRGYRAAAVGRVENFLAIGIDAEPNEELSAALLEAIATPRERAWVRQRSAIASGVCWGRLLFSIKESVYKACNPFARGALGFEDATVMVEPERRTFSARLSTAAGWLGGFRFDVLAGRWLVRDGLILTAVLLGPLPVGCEWAELPHTRAVDVSHRYADV